MVNEMMIKVSLIPAPEEYNKTDIKVNERDQIMKQSRNYDIFFHCFLYFYCLNIFCNNSRLENLLYSHQNLII